MKSGDKVVIKASAMDTLPPEFDNPQWDVKKWHIGATGYIDRSSMYGNFYFVSVGSSVIRVHKDDLDRVATEPPAESRPDLRKLTSNEVRVTSETGGAKGVKEARFDQIPVWPLWQLAVKFGRGNEKYEMTEDGLDNWRKGYEWSKSYAACMRHLTAFWSGEDIDEETGQLHLIAVAWHAMVMSEWWSREEMHKFDDRQDPRNPLEVKG